MPSYYIAGSATTTSAVDASASSYTDAIINGLSGYFKDSYPDYRLSGWYVGGSSSSNYWSSTVYSSLNAWYVSYNGRLYNIMQTGINGCCPVLEL